MTRRDGQASVAEPHTRAAAVRPPRRPAAAPDPPPVFAAISRWFSRGSGARTAPDLRAQVRAAGAAAAATPSAMRTTAAAVSAAAMAPPELPADALAIATAALETRMRAVCDAAVPGDAAALRALCAAVTAAPADAVRQLPSAARDAIAVCDDAGAGAAELARVCERDLAVVPALLRFANSAHYARAGQAPAASLREAVDRVGVTGVRNVLLEVTMSALLAAPNGRHGTLVTQLWSHAQRTAAVARAAAPAFGVHPDRAYAAGLLHDVGKLVLLDRLAVAPVAGLPWSALRAALVTLHEPLGAVAVLRWGVGADAARAVGAHHRAAPAAPDALAEVLYLAERVDHLVTAGAPVDLEALWAAGALGGARDAAAGALARHLGPLLSPAAAAA